MPVFLRSLSVAGISYALMHNNDTDNRIVVRLSDMGDQPVLHIDSALRITGKDGAFLSHIRREGDNYVMTYGDTSYILGARRFEDWTALELAECEAARIILADTEAQQG